MTDQKLFRIEPALFGKRRECAAFARSRLTNSFLIYSICLCLTIACVFLGDKELARKTTVAGEAQLVEGELKLYANARRRVQETRVTEGELVRKGQLLAILRSLDHPPATSTRGQSPPATSAVLASLNRERSNLLAMRQTTQEEAEARQQLIRQQLRGIKARMNIQREERSASESLRDIAGEQLERGRELQQAGHLSLTQLDELQRRSSEAQRELARSRRDLLMLQEQQGTLSRELELAIQTLPNKLRQLDTQLGANEREFARQRLVQEQRLTAPVDGLITGVLSYPGATVAPQQPLITMVRNGVGFRARLWASSRAAGELTAGQNVRLMLDAFPHQKHGMLNGRIQHINESPLTLQELGAPWDGKGSVYGVTVALDVTSPLYARLKPGMNLTADIKLDQSLLFERLFEPLITAWQRTL